MRNEALDVFVLNLAIRQALPRYIKRPRMFRSVTEPFVAPPPMPQQPNVIPEEHTPEPEFGTEAWHRKEIERLMPNRPALWQQRQPRKQLDTAPRPQKLFLWPGLKLEGELKNVQGARLLQTDLSQANARRAATKICFWPADATQTLPCRGAAAAAATTDSEFCVSSRHATRLARSEWIRNA
jgi:hypothetical protein